MDSNNIDLNNMQFNQQNISGYKCNVNRIDVNLMSSFEDIIIRYESKMETYMNETNPYPININNLKDMCITIPDGKNMSNKEFYKEYYSKRLPFWKHLIDQLYSKKGYEKPSPIQSVTIPELINYKDGLIQFKSGTGKTAAFLTGLLWGFEQNVDQLQYIFMTSTHQIAQQIYSQVIELMPESTKVVLCIGNKRNGNDDNNTGAFKKTLKKTSALEDRPLSLKDEINRLKNAQIIVCTIGKFYNYLVDRKYIKSLGYVKGFCVDEFDIIVEPRFQKNRDSVINVDQIGTIINMLPAYTQRVFFSATVTSETLSITSGYFRKYSPDVGEPLVILLDTDDYTLEGIRQYYVKIESYQEKKDCLYELLQQLRITQCIIFVNKIETTNDLKFFLDSKKIPIPSAVFHSGMSSEEQNDVYKKFKDNKFRLLISTDKLSRGIDIQSINIVFNFDMPRELATYIHRIGRSGRYGRKGTTISFITVNPIMKINEMLSVNAIDECSTNNKMMELPEDISNLL